MKKKYAMIAPHEHLVQVARDVCEEFALPCEVVSCNSNGIAIEMAKKFCSDGVRLIISRGGMAKAIANEIAQPVIPIEIGFKDLISAIAVAKNYGSKIGVIINSQLEYDLEKIREILQVRVEKLEILPQGNLIDTITRAKKDQFDVIVGGASPTYFAEAVGIKAVPLESGRESIKAALLRAQDLVEAEYLREVNNQSLKQMLDSSHDGILIADAAGTILLLNATAEKLLCVRREHILGKSYSAALPFLPPVDSSAATQGDVSEICKVNNTVLLCNLEPILLEGGYSGTIITFYDAKCFENLHAKIHNELYLKGHVAHYSFRDIITQNKRMRKVLERAKLFSEVDSTILITGETGTGKELFAQSIHNSSARRNAPFVAINCASIPDTILESELFGYEAGAFTGASKGGKRGYFEMADGGSLFLDEIGEIPMKLQSKLLRVLQQKEIVRVGGDKVIPVNVRVISATLADLGREIEAGNFRRDLYYRLNILRLSIPPLRERIDDLPLLARQLSKSISARLALPVLILGNDCMRRLEAYPWRGNVRELENVLERLTIIGRKKAINLEELEDVLEDIAPQPQAETQAPVGVQTLAELEKRRILDTLEQLGGDRVRACELLGISPTTLWRRLKSWGFQYE